MKLYETIEIKNRDFLGEEIGAAVFKMMKHMALVIKELEERIEKIEGEK